MQQRSMDVIGSSRRTNWLVLFCHSAICTDTKGKDKTICHFYGGSVYLGINLAKKKLWGENFFHVDIRNLRRKLGRCVIDAYVSERRGTDLG